MFFEYLFFISFVLVVSNPIHKMSVSSLLTFYVGHDITDIILQFCTDVIHGISRPSNGRSECMKFYPVWKHGNMSYNTTISPTFFNFAGSDYYMKSKKGLAVRAPPTTLLQFTRQKIDGFIKGTSNLPYSVGMCGSMVMNIDALDTFSGFPVYKRKWPVKKWMSFCIKYHPTIDCDIYPRTGELIPIQLILEKHTDMTSPRRVKWLDFEHLVIFDQDQYFIYKLLRQDNTVTGVWKSSSSYVRTGFEAQETTHEFKYDDIRFHQSDPHYGRIWLYMNDKRLGILSHSGIVIVESVSFDVPIRFESLSLDEIYIDDGHDDIYIINSSLSTRTKLNIQADKVSCLF